MTPEVKQTFLIGSILSLIILISSCKQAGRSDKEQIFEDSKQSESVVGTEISESSNRDSGDSLLESINQLIRKDLNNPDLYLRRAAIYDSLDDVKMAVQDLDRAFLIDSTYLPTILSQADFLARRGKVELGLKMLERGKRHHPESSKLYEQFAELFLIAGNNSLALKNADLAIKYDKFNANAYYLKGYNFLEIGDTAKAISSYQTAVEQNPKHFDAYLELGYIYSAMDDPLALEYFENALSIKPTEKRVLYAKGMYEQSHELYNEAMQTYLKATKHHPNFREAYYNLGYLHLSYLGLYRQATIHFTEAIEVDPNYYEAYYNRGYSFEMLGDIGNAAKDYRKALSINPEYDLAAKGLSRVTEDL